MPQVSSGTNVGTLTGSEKIPIGGASPSVTTPADIKNYVEVKSPAISLFLYYNFY